MEESMNEQERLEQVKKIAAFLKAYVDHTNPEAMSDDRILSEFGHCDEPLWLERAKHLMKFALYQQPKEQGNIPQSPIQHAANCQAYYMGTNGQLPCNCGAEKQPKEQPSTDNPNNITRLPVNMIQPNLYSQPLDEEIEKTHDDWVYDHENITCAGTLEKAIAQAQLLKVQPELAKLQARIVGGL